MSNRYLLCRPRGGLNDTLCRIQACWRYAERSGRHLVIDTAASSLAGDFTDYFELLPTAGPVTPVLDAPLLAHLNTLVCRPAVVAGRLDRYVARPMGDRGFVEQVSGERTRFDLEALEAAPTDLCEPLLVYDDSGGGSASFELLARVRFSAAVRASAREALAALGPDYVTVHVRNTDDRTDYVGLFERLRRRVGRRVLLVRSDDPAVVDYARGVFAGPVLVSTVRQRSAHPQGVQHYPEAYHDVEARRRAAMDSLVDLVALSNARRLYYAPIGGVLDLPTATGQLSVRPLRVGPVSGFSHLARYLCTRKDRLDALLDVPANQRRDPDLSAATEVCSMATRLRRWLSRSRTRARAAFAVTRR